MRAGWFRAGLVGAVLAVIVVAYLVTRSSTGGGASHEDHRAVRQPGFASQVETIRKAMSGAGEARSLKTERCPTQAGVGGAYVRPPSRVQVRLPRGSTTNLVAYAASNGTLLPAPANWECTASIGVDGTEEVGAGPIGSVTAKKAGAFPELHRSGRAVRVTLIPACQGCIASAICSFFPRAAVAKIYERLEPCADRPEGELRSQVSHSAYAFVDPAGVRGSSIGSGGPFPSLGFLSYSTAAGIRELSCTAAVGEMSACADAIAAFVSLAHRL
jgi:hypothetical protein